MIIKGVVEETPWGDNPYPFCGSPNFVWEQHWPQIRKAVYSPSRVSGPSCLSDPQNLAVFVGTGVSLGTGKLSQGWCFLHQVISVARSRDTLKNLIKLCWPHFPPMRWWISVYLLHCGVLQDALPPLLNSVGDHIVPFH